ncbi:MAG: MATE family efflux transporter [Dorea sp.]|jgi:putative MATE family efflux protein|nr:MATE family efflux transporter [Dorea sp.]
MKLEGTSLKKDFIRFIVPSIAAQWVFTLYTMVDGIFVARGVSETALTAVNIAMPYTMMLFSISILFAVGTSTVTAILLGEKNEKKANEVFTQNIVLLAVFSVIITILVMLNLERTALFLGATELNKAYVLEYLMWLVPFSAAFILSYSFEMLIKTDGFPKRATVIVTTGALLNVVLDYVMVMRMHMGVGGAAFATGISNTVVIILYLFHFCGKSGVIKFCKFKFDISLVGREFKNGLSSGITELSAGFIIFLFNQAIIRLLNDEALVSYTIISYVNSLGVMAMVGIAQGYQPLVSYYYGQKRTERCQKLKKYGIAATAVLSVIYTAACMIFAKQIVSLFVSEEMTGLMDYSITVLRIFSLSFLLAGYNVVIGGYFIAVEETFAATGISLSRSIVSLTVCLLILTMLFKGAGIWWTPLLSEAVTLIFTIIMLGRYKKSLFTLSR